MFYIVMDDIEGENGMVYKTDVVSHETLMSLVSDEPLNVIAFKDEASAYAYLDHIEGR